MIRTVVTLLNKFHRYATVTPLEIIENRYPAYVGSRLNQLAKRERSLKIAEQKLKVRKAQADPLGLELIELEQSYNKQSSTMSRNEFLGRREQIYQKMRQSQIKKRNLG